MKFVITVLLVCSNLISFAQTKEDFLACFEIIMEQEDFQPAFENRGITGESLIIVTNNNRSANQNEIEKIRNSLTTNDFYNFSETVKVIQGDDKAVRSQGYDPIHVLQIGFGGQKDVLVFMLSTGIENQNLMYNWNYKFVKKEQEWILVGQNIWKTKIR